MGAGVGKPASAGPSIEGEYKYNFRTGYAYVSPNIISNANVVKKPGIALSEIWGPYKKQYTKSSFGQDLFTPPAKVDDIPILCRCRFIYQYMRSSDSSLMLSSLAAMISSSRPACWEDNATIWNPQGGDTFTVTIGHPAFYEYTINSGGSIGALTGFRGFTLGGTRRKQYRARLKKSTRQKKPKQRKTAQRS
jgi:hypothetical protein